MASAAARMGLGNESFRLLRLLMEADGAIVDDTCFAEGQGNRWTYFLTTCGALVSALNEMLLQSYEPETIRVLPAFPVAWHSEPISFSRLRARGGILVSASYTPEELRITLASPRATSRSVVFPRPKAVPKPIVTVDGAERSTETLMGDRLTLRVELRSERPTVIHVRNASG